MSNDIGLRFGYVKTYDIDGQEREEPAMGLYPSGRKQNPPVFAIPLSSAYLYAENDTLLKKSFQIAEFFNFFPDRFTVNRIADLILNYLPDLITMKPFVQADKGREIGEGKARINGDVVSDFGITSTGGILK